MRTISKGGRRRKGMDGIWDGKHTGRWRMRKGSSDGCWLLEGKNGICGWRRRIRRYKPRKRSTPQPSSDSSPRIGTQIHLQLIVPDLLLHIPPSQRRQLGPLRRVIPRLDFEMVILIFRVFRSSSWVVVGIRRLG